MKCGDVIVEDSESYVVIAVRSSGEGYAVPITGNVYRYSWAFFTANAKIEFNILDRMPVNHKNIIEKILTVKKKA